MGPAARDGISRRDDDDPQGAPGARVAGVGGRAAVPCLLGMYRGRLP
ncbi:hypothetical protein [Mycolicibacterium goodii]|nr:hypothetical protein [Mycolicibacterium goodii]